MTSAEPHRPDDRLLYNQVHLQLSRNEPEEARARAEEIRDETLRAMALTLIEQHRHG